MTRNSTCKSKIRKFSYGGLLLATLSLTGVTLALSADLKESGDHRRDGNGTSTQLGKMCEREGDPRVSESVARSSPP